ncbi:MAG: outer membrane protein [Flammeovirgaceae bacterium]|jgi:outer membrane protein
MRIAIQLFIALILMGRLASAQEIDLNGAIAIALVQNYDVLVASYSYEIEQNNSEIGNAGFMPSVFLQANGNYSSQNTEVTFPNPEQPTISQDGASTISYGASANLEYVLFNGGRRVHFLNQLQSFSEDARLRQRLSMENTTLLVSSRFLESLRLKEEVDILQETIELSQKRMERAEQGYNYGNSTKLEVLNAEVDLRRDSVALAQTDLNYARSLRNLYLTMGIPADTSLTLSSDYEFSALLDKQVLLDKALEANTIYLRARNNVFSADENLDVAQSDIWPTLAANAAYQYQYSDFEANFLNTQENLGWNAGLTFRFNIFDGNRVQRNIANARLNREIAEVEMDRSRNQVVQLVNNAYDTYLTNLELLDISERNLELARTNFSRSEDAFATGQITGIELRNAQLNLSDAQTAIVRQNIITKVAELGLLYEAGALLE